MVLAISEILKYRKSTKTFDPTIAIREISKIARNEKNPEAKLLMIAAASTASELIEKDPRLTDKQIIQKVVYESFPKLLKNVEENSIKDNSVSENYEEFLQP